MTSFLRELRVGITSFARNKSSKAKKVRSYNQKNEMKELENLIRSSIVEDFTKSDFCYRDNILNLFGSPSKFFRPNLLLQLSFVLNADESNKSFVSPKQLMIAKFSEMVHVASLIHDDVIDSAKTRRCRPTINSQLGDRAAILSGDYIISKATFLISELDDAVLTDILSQVIQDLVLGEIKQFKDIPSVLAYNDIIKNKTASLLALTCKSVIYSHKVISHAVNAPKDVLDNMHRFGECVGLSFQIIDDCMDFSGDKKMGKPKFNDLKNGLVTLPVIYAAEQFPEINALIERKFNDQDDIENIRRLVFESHAIDRCKQLSKELISEAIDIVKNYSNKYAQILIDYILMLHERNS
ncbi:Decaprenyl-diphosphate synthase subunit 1 [Thelohanellus kitauei]|uniref:Decaprenyl-diphosphate synthase subunit 1 n=1 Tax=Thelohanellus kitauei TaxID=669202 RepID=A0A0C2IVN3_THEKT|nr:Decaprenyl-diphosphate synthase subunit 1 [Thelohanellus kitauei]